MGSDIYRFDWFIPLIRLINFFFWSALIVKSARMSQILGIKKVYIIPNGVDLNLFYPIDHWQAIVKLGWTKRKRHILFAGDPKRPEKNVELFNKSSSIELIKVEYLNFCIKIF